MELVSGGIAVHDASPTDRCEHDEEGLIVVQHRMEFFLVWFIVRKRERERARENDIEKNE